MRAIATRNAILSVTVCISMRSIMPVRLMNFSTDCLLMKIRIRPWAKFDFCGYRAIFRMNPLRLADHGYFIAHRHAALPLSAGEENDRAIPQLALACFLFAFDFMHFYTDENCNDRCLSVLRDCLPFLCTINRHEFYDTPPHKTFLPTQDYCGVCVRTLACKWTGVYAGCGLALLFSRIADATGNTLCQSTSPAKAQMVSIINI